MTHRRTRTAAATARFRDLDPQDPYAHHDAMEFPDGLVVPLTRLIPGQRASVLQLPARAVGAGTTQPAAVTETASEPA